MTNSIPRMFRKKPYQLPTLSEWTVGHYTQYQQSSSPTKNSYEIDNDLSQDNQNLTRILPEFQSQVFSSQEHRVEV
jgi:hypothetical protein